MPSSTCPSTCAARKGSLRLRRAVEADVPAMSKIYFEAFADTYICRNCFAPTLASSRSWMEDFLHAGIKMEASHFLVVVDGDGHDGHDNNDNDGHVVAFARWVGTRPNGVPAEDEWTKDPCPPEGDVELARLFFSAMHAAHVEIMGKEPHWFLSLIGTKPEAQGRGAAGLLMRWGLAQADAEGTRAFLDATQAGKPIYEKFGFREVKSLVFVDGKIRQDCMVREAKAT